jgi:hypothetical protein
VTAFGVGAARHAVGMESEQSDETDFGPVVSSNDDGGGAEGVWAGVGPKPWWFGNPELTTIVQRSLEELEGDPREPPSDEPDPVLREILTGDIWRELAATTVAPALCQTTGVS